MRRNCPHKLCHAFDGLGFGHTSPSVRSGFWASGFHRNECTRFPTSPALSQDLQAQDVHTLAYAHLNLHDMESVKDFHGAENDARPKDCEPEGDEQEWVPIEVQHVRDCRA